MQSEATFCAARAQNVVGKVNYAEERWILPTPLKGQNMEEVDFLRFALKRQSRANSGEEIGESIRAPSREPPNHVGFLLPPLPATQKGRQRRPLAWWEEVDSNHRSR